VLVEGDDMMDPVADTVRSILDGHLVLSRALANRGHYPSIDPLQSISRAMAEVVSSEDRLRAEAVRTLLARYRDSEDLIQIGAYAQGSDPQVDQAIEMRPAIDAFTRQDRDESTDFSDTWSCLRALGDQALAGPAAQTVAAEEAAPPPGTAMPSMISPAAVTREQVG
jgi:flagellar biosynthesis/type III secretory pathway ATPase